ncbi:MAG: prolyl oligopeptidase family serine peptidase, partial [Micropruina sp.]
MISASHGSWTSPIDVELVSAPSAARPSEPQLDRGVAYWLEARPSEGGRVTLCREGGADVTPGFNVRSRVHEYGGGAYHVNHGVTVFNDLISGRVHRWGADGSVPITPENPAWRYADLRVHPERGLLLAVREDHSAPGEPVNSIVALSLEGPNTDGGTPLCLGADFYASPELSGDGRLAWVEWNHPNMPWDATLLRVALLTQGAAGPLLAEPTTVAGGPEEAAGFPLWRKDGALVYVSDRDGWSKPYRAGNPHPLVNHDADTVPPLWVFGQRPWAESADGRLHHAPWQHLGGIAAGGSRVVFIEGSTDQPPSVVALDVETGRRVTLAGGGAVIESAWVSRGESITWEGPAGEVQGWFYPPTNPEFTAPAGDLPPLITMTHGGPTAFADNSFALRTQFWTSRGFSVLDVNYSGSAGLGRAYRNRLRGQWGVLDVADVVAGATALAERGLVDGARLAIRGGSAGGYTTLRA